MEEIPVLSAPDQRRVLLRALAAVDALEAWDHPLGFAHVRLPEELTGVRTRLHIWRTGIAARELGLRDRVHNHSFGFVSHILLGRVISCPFFLNPRDDGAKRIAKVQAGTGRATLIPTTVRCLADQREVVEYRAGAIYRMAAGDFHDAMGLDDMTATLILAKPRPEVESLVVVDASEIQPRESIWNPIDAANLGALLRTIIDAVSAD